MPEAKSTLGRTKSTLGRTGSRLLEREEDLGRLEAALETAAAGAGQTVLVEAPAGAGKSVLVRAAGEIAEAQGAGVLRATGRQIEERFAFGVAIQLLSPALERVGTAQREQLLTGAAELARPLLERGSANGSSGDAHATLHGLHWLCVNLAAARPLATLVDDAHWADGPSLSFLPYLAARLAEVPICLIASVRTSETEDGERFTAALRGAGATVLRPQPLSEAAVGRLAASRLSSEPTPQLVRKCAQATGGNPLFVRELLRHLVDSDAAGANEASGAAPESVGRIVLERLRHLSENAQDVIRALAILGDGAEPGLVATLSGVEAERVGPELDRLIAAGLLEAELPPRFEHPIVRQAVYESIAPAARARGHLAAARVLAGDAERAELAAAHLLQTEGVAEDAGAEAVEALRLAALRARERGASEEGARFLSRALAEPLDRETRRELLLELGTEELRLGREHAVERLREAEALSEGAGERGEAALSLSAAQSQTGALGDAAVTCERALEFMGESDRELRLALLGQQATARWLGGTMSDDDRRRLHGIEGEVAGAQTPAERLVLTILAAEAAQTGSRPAGEVAELAARALGGGRMLADLGAEHPAYTLAAAAQTLSGDFAASVEEWSLGLDHSRRRGSLYGYANSLFSRAYANYLAGDMPGAEADAVEGLELLPGSELVTAPFPLAAAAHVAAERGDMAPAQEQALEELVALGDSPAPHSVNYAVTAAGWLALAQGDFERALARFEQAGRRTEQIGMLGPTAMPWRSGAARALHGLGRPEEAVALVDDELRRARAYEEPGSEGIALRTKAAVTEREDRVELAREAVETLARSDAALEHAKALIGLGMALRRVGSPNDAREPLREGMHLANRCGSKVAVERAMEELRAAGMRPRRPALRGAESLSPQERQTAKLAAAEMSNREIAEAMFLTRRTVEMHLSGAYRKLGISSREELAGALEADLPSAA